VADDLIGASEIADMFGVTRQRVHQLRTEYEDFPKPVTPVTERQMAYWRRAQVERWARRHDYLEER
jgi:hypothetical protein